MLKMFVNTAKGIFKSAFTFPSNVFWVATFSSLCGQLFSAGMCIVSGDILEGLIPTKSTLLASDWFFAIIIMDLIQIVSQIRIHYMIQRYYKHMIYNAAPKAKLIATKYLKYERITFVFIAISHIFLIFTNPEGFPNVHYVSVLVYYVSFCIYSKIIDKLNYIKNGEIYPVGYVIDYFLIPYTAICLPYTVYLMWAEIYGLEFLFLALISFIMCFLADLKYVFFALMVLGDRFLRIESSGMANLT